MGEDQSVEKKDTISEFAVTPEGRIFLDLVRFPAYSKKPTEDDHRLMRAISTTYPGILDKIAETLEQKNLPAPVRHHFKILDQVYGVSTRVPRQQTDVAKKAGVSAEAIRQTRNRGLRELLWRVRIETDQGQLSLGRVRSIIKDGLMAAP